MHVVRHSPCLRMLVGSFFVCLLACYACAPPKGDPRQQSADNLEHLVRDAHGKDTETRQKAIGILLGRLKYGMTRKQVEKLIGSPDFGLELRERDSTQVGSAQYQVRFPDLDDSWHMFLDYDVSKNPPRLIRILGPMTILVDEPSPPNRFDIEKDE